MGLVGYSLFSFWTLVYFVCPEYIYTVAPVLLLLFLSVRTHILLISALSFPWAINFFDGVRAFYQNSGSDTVTLGGRGSFVRLYNELFSASPEVMHVGSIIVWIVISLLLWGAVAFRLSQLVRESKDESCVTEYSDA